MKLKKDEKAKKSATNESKQSKNFAEEQKQTTIFWTETFLHFSVECNGCVYVVVCVFVYICSLQSVFAWCNGWTNNLNNVPHLIENR